MRKIILSAMVVCLLVASAVPVFAEAFFDIYGGVSTASDATMRLLRTDNSITSGDVSFSGEASYGLRAGAWLPRVPWLGVGGDFSSLHLRGRDTSIDLLPITPIVLFRLPLLVDEEVPQGWVQPYAGIGPSFTVYTYMHTSLVTPINSITATGGLTGGFQVPAGLNIQLSRRVALFTEYRYAYYVIHLDRDSESQESIPSNILRNEKVRTNLSLHNVFAGISFHF